MKLQFHVQLKIQKTINEVFAAVYEPEQLQRYFTTASASGPLKEGTTVQWEFADHPGAFPVKVTKVVRNKLIAIEWAGGIDYSTQVEISFDPVGATATVVKITEAGWKEDEQGLDRSYLNCQGWMNMLCCLKAYLEYDINLRKGAF